MNKNVVIVIPAYEPPKEMLSLIKKLQKENFQIVIVDDGSKESYASIFEKAARVATVIKHKKNLGKGKALKTAFHYIAKNDPNSIIVTMDCDGQHTINDAKKIITYMQSHENELVLGKRLRGKNTPLRSKIGNSITRLIYYFATGYSLYDTQTGLRAFDSKYLPFMKKIPGERFEYEMNVILYGSKMMKITEIEIETIYIDHNSGSHFKTIQDSFQIYREIFKFISPTLISLVIAYFLFFLCFEITGKIILSNLLGDLIALLSYQILKEKQEKIGKKTSLFATLLLSMILLFNTILLDIFVTVFAFSPFLVKAMLEICFLFAFFLARQFYICKEKEN